MDQAVDTLQSSAHAEIEGCGYVRYHTALYAWNLKAALRSWAV